MSVFNWIWVYVLVPYLELAAIVSVVALILCCVSYLLLPHELRTPRPDGFEDN